MPVRIIPSGGGGGGGGGGAGAVAWGPFFGEQEELTLAAAASMPELALDHTKTAGVSVSNIDLGVAYSQSLGAAASMPTLALDHTKTCGVDVEGLTYSAVGIIASKDSWADAVAGCVANLNHDDPGGTAPFDLEVNGVTATRRDSYIGFDLSGFPTGATVIAGYLRVRLARVPLLGAEATASLDQIAGSGETWAEATLTCSNRPAVVVNGSSITVPAGASVGDQVWSDDLVNGDPSAIAARMGVGTYTLVINSPGLTNFALSDREGGSSEAPRLDLYFTVPV